MAEQEELRLVVTLDDQASAALTQLKGQLEQLGRSEPLSKQNAALTEFKKQSRDAVGSVRDLEGSFRNIAPVLNTASEGLRSFAGLLGAGGIGGGLVGALALVDIGISKFAESVIRLGDSARAAGVSTGQFKVLTEQLERFGYSTDEAQSTLGRFFTTINEALRPGSREYQRILSDALDPDYVFSRIQEMQRDVASGRSAQALTTAARLLKDRYDNIVEQGRARNIDARGEAARQVQAYAESLGLTLKAMDLRRLVEASPKEIADWEHRDQMMRKFNENWKSLAQTGEEFLAIIVEKITPAFDALNQQVDELGRTWKEQISDRIQTEFETLARLGRLFNDLRGGQFGEALRELQTDPRAPRSIAPPGVAPPIVGEPRVQEGGRFEELLGAPRTTVPGGAQRAPTSQEQIGMPRQFFTGAGGDGGRFTPDPNFLAGSPMSTNIEDRRALTEDNTDQMEKLTGELRRLNDSFELGGGEGLGPLSTQMGGLRRGLGAGGGFGGPGTGGGGIGGFGQPIPGYRGGPSGRAYGNDSGPGTGAGAGQTPAGTSAGQVPWPEPGAGNVMPPGFGGEGPGIGGGGATPWAGTVVPGGGGAWEGKPIATPEGWGPGGSGQPWGIQPSGGGGAGGGTGEPLAGGTSNYLAEARASRIAEINRNPALKAEVLGMLRKESGESVSGMTATFETLLARSQMVGNTIDQELHSGFYSTVKSGAARAAGGLGGIAERAFNAGAAGSNLTKSRTDQGMIGDPNWQGPGRVPVAGTSEIYNYWKGERGGRQYTHEMSQRFAEQEQAKVAAGAAGQGPAAMTAAQPGEAAPYRQQGQVSLGGQTFPWASGGGGRGSIPYGTFPINIGKGDIGAIGQRIGSIATVGGEGGTINDPRYPHLPREGIQIHPGSGATLDQLYTAGCFGVPKAQWPAFKAALLAEAAKNPEGLALQVNKGGQAVIGARSSFAMPGRTGGAAGGGGGAGGFPGVQFPGLGGLPGFTPGKRDEDLDVAAGKGGRAAALIKPDEFLDRAAGKGRMLDKAAGQRVDVNGTGKLEVDVRAPAGTSVGASGGGLFKKVEMNRQTTMAKAASGPSESAASGAGEE